MADHSSQSIKLTKCLRSCTDSDELGHLTGKSKTSCRLVALSHSFKAWKTLKEKCRLSNPELAAHLLDVHGRFCKQPGCVSLTESSPDQSHALTEKKDLQYHEEGRKEDFKASDAPGSVCGKESVVNLSKAVQNQNLESNATSVSVSTSLSPHKDTTETFEIGRERGKARCGLVALSYSFKAWEAVRKKFNWNNGELAAHLLEVHGQFCQQPRCVSSESCSDQSQVLSKRLKQTAKKKSLHNGERIMLHISDQTIKKEKKERDGHSVQFGTAQREVELKESTFGASDETSIKVEDDSDHEGHGNDPDWIVEVGIEFICTDEDGDDGYDEDEEEDDEEEDDDEDGCPSEEDKSMKDKKQKHGHQVTDGSFNRFVRGKCTKLSESLKGKMRRQNHVVTEVPFRRFDMEEVARAEGFSDTSMNKTRIRKLYWTELERVYRCRICSAEDSNVYSTCRHLLQEHPEVVGDLEEYLKGRPALDLEPDSTLYDKVMDVPPPNDSVAENSKESESCDGIGEEMGSVEISEEGSQSSDSVGRETKYNPLDSMESVEFLERWVKLQLSCQFCQKVISCVLFTQSGKRIIHRCRSGKIVPSLCEICGKSFIRFKQHWLSKHTKSEEKVCPHCNKRTHRLNAHIARCHPSTKNQYQCGICRKKFHLRRSLDKHAVIHQKEKPFKCTYCQRGFSQSSNMKYHMRQHTGEKPYQCNKCPESFAHNVSLKNHLKSKHGIDPWKMDPAGD
ncbi:Zinc finger protein Gfi-1 [Holothuria leucospilota]|uniref:Zinc finger protein Gfi-1 n=1 Tax=Holothuria leucospilota TaxID=206669 RepID=A0A9Q0YNQ4_HOLLE|nr:Zinc finger protein Gfi-1 [Holothuria leucospilota]